ncbi:Uncharacterised protein [Serratia fonticola]|nr:Uncharacterised protein [Serratia fonticola]
MFEGLRACYTLFAVSDFGSVRLPLPVGEGWGEGDCRSRLSNNTCQKAGLIQ